MANQGVTLNLAKPHNLKIPTGQKRVQLWEQVWKKPLLLAMLDIQGVVKSCVKAQSATPFNILQGSHASATITMYVE